MPDLLRLYAQVGYDPDAEQKALDLVSQLLAHIQVDIPDHSSLAGSVDRLSEKDKAVVDPHVIKALLKAPGNITELLHILRAKLSSAVASASGLGRQDPTWSLLNLPTQVASLIVTRPSDPKSFSNLLGELEQALEYGPQSGPARKATLNEIQKLRDLLLPNSGERDFRAQVERLADKVNNLIYWECHHDFEIQERKKRLDDLLYACENFRHEFGPRINVRSIGFEGMVKMVRDETRKYLDSNWMHTQSITGYVASTLIDTELALLLWPKTEWVQLPILESFGLKLSSIINILIRIAGKSLALRRLWQHTLWTISEELDSGTYDSLAISRRLRDWEQKGFYVHSLVHSLLMLHTGNNLSHLDSA